MRPVDLLPILCYLPALGGRTKLDDIARGQRLVGVAPNQVVTVKSAEMLGPDTLELIFRDASGQTGDRLLQRTDEATIELATDLRPWSFEAAPSPVPRQGTLI